MSLALGDNVLVAAWIGGGFAVVAAVLAAVLPSWLASRKPTKADASMPRQAAGGPRVATADEARRISDFREAALKVYDRVAKLRTAVDAVGDPGRARAALANGGQPLTDELWLLGGNLDQLGESFAACPDPPPFDDYERAAGMLREVLVEHRFENVSDADLAATLRTWIDWRRVA